MNTKQFISKAKAINTWWSQSRITYWIIPSMIYGVSMNVSALELSDYLNSATVASSAAQFETNLTNNTDDVQVTPNAELTLVKIVENDDGGDAVVADFAIATDATIDPLIFTSSIAGTTTTYTSQVISVAPSTYTFNEIDFAGYTEGTWSCVDVDSVPLTLIDDAFDAGELSLAFGVQATCTITNDDDAPGLTIVKDVTNDNGGNAVAADFTLRLNGGVFDGSVARSSGDTPVVVANTAYTLSEDILAGYTQTTIVCTDDSDSSVVAHPVTLDEGQSVTCTISNDDDAASLIIVKDVVNDDGGDALVGEFGITTTAGALIFDAGTTVVDTTTYTAGTLTVDANTAFDLAEIDLAGYTEGSWSCDNGDGGAFGAGSVTLDEGATVTCTISNDDDAASLIIVKDVVNDHGGDAVVGEFGITTTAGALTFDAGTTVVDTTTYTAGTLTVDANTAFDLAEINLGGYTEGSWICGNGDGGAFNVGSVTLDEGETVTCTITNDDDAPGLTIVKDVVNDNGGDAVAADFVLHLTGGIYDGSVDRASGDTPVVISNTEYTLSEDALAGYTQTAIGCVDDVDGITVVPHPVTLAEGQSVTCTISNDDDAASLIIIKDVVNDNGGDAVVADFSITTTAGALVFDAGTVAGDTTTYTAGTLTVDANTAFDLAEIDLAGYTEGTWSCDNGGGGAFGTGSVTLDEGAIVTCAISNDDDTASLIVVKDVVNDHGGDAIVGEFVITTTAGALTFDAGTVVGDTTTYTAGTLAVDANTAFDLAEINLGGYTEGAWTCDNGDGGAFNVGSVTLDEGETVTCTISNDDDEPGLTIVKDVLNDNGGNAVAADFTLRLNGGIYDGSVARISGETPVVIANTEYTLSEDALAGYTQTAIGCVDDVDGITVVPHPVTLAEGQSVTCTISNDDDAASLIIIKDVVNDNGGDAVVADFSITTTAGALVFDAGTVAGDTTTYTAGTLTVDANTAFDLAEIDLAGYTEGSWSCDNGDGGAFGAGSVTLDEGATATCTISNDDDTANLTIVKEVLNDNGGTGVVGDFGITTDAGGLIFDAGTTVGDTTTYTATALTVDANTPFSLSESDLAAYTEGAWTCTNGDGGTFDSGSVTLDEGESVVCTINNDDRGVDLSIVKTVDDMTPDIGDTITFSLEVSNAGPDEATDVSVTDVLPAGFVYGATIPAAGVTETTVAAPNLAWTITSIPSGSSVTIEFTATVLAP